MFVTLQPECGDSRTPGFISSSVNGLAMHFPGVKLASADVFRSTVWVIFSGSCPLLSLTLFIQSTGFFPFQTSFPGLNFHLLGVEVVFFTVLGKVYLCVHLFVTHLTHIPRIQKCFKCISQKVLRVSLVPE